MERINGQTGLFQMSQSFMPGKPAEYRLPKYEVPGGLDRVPPSADKKGFLEEMVARIMAISAAEGVWCHISLSFLIHTMCQDLDELQKARLDQVEVDSVNKMRRQLYRRSLWLHYFFTFLTFGIYGWMVRKPAEPVVEVSNRPPSPKTLVATVPWGFLPENIAPSACKQLQSYGLVGIVEYYDEKEKRLYTLIDPTPALVQSLQRFRTTSA